MREAEIKAWRALNDVCWLACEVVCLDTSMCHLCVFACMCVCMCLCMCVSLYVSLHLDTYVRVHACMPCMYMHACEVLCLLTATALAQATSFWALVQCWRYARVCIATLPPARLRPCLLARFLCGVSICLPLCSLSSLAYICLVSAWWE